MLTDRDRKITRFLEEFGAASTRQIHALFFDGLNIVNCQMRLKLLTERGHIKRDRSGIDKDYVYYVSGLPAQVEHHAVRVDFYIAAKNKLELVDFIPEYRCESLRADGYFEFEYDGLRFGAFLEVQLSAGFDQTKYEKFFASGNWHGYWDAFPPVVVVTDRAIRIRPSEVKFILMGLDFDFEKLLREI